MPKYGYGLCAVCWKAARYRVSIGGDLPLVVCEECTDRAWSVAAAVAQVRARGYTVEMAPDAYGRVAFRVCLRHYPARLLSPVALVSFAEAVRGWTAAAQYDRFARAWYGEALTAEGPGAPAGTTPYCATDAEAIAMAEEIVYWHVVGGRAPAWEVG